MCGKDCGCKNGSMKRLASKANLRSVDIRTERLGGQQFTILPVVMAKAGVVMNGQLIEEAELFPDSWNGRPVTIGHPILDGVNISANQPDVLRDWAVGQLFNAKVENGALKAEAWVNNEQLERVAPGFLASIRNGANIDVSTGYWSDDTPAQGTSEGRTYETIGTNLKPDHLAFLPGEEGACNWSDGCGIRANAAIDDDPIAAALFSLAEAITQRRSI